MSQKGDLGIEGFTFGQMSGATRMRTMGGRLVSVPGVGSTIFEKARPELD